MRIDKVMGKWIHPAACGAIAGRECVEAAWDAQLDIESAYLNDRELTLVTADYTKFFDSFDPEFFRCLAVAMGIPERVAKLVWYLNANMRR